MSSPTFCCHAASVTYWVGHKTRRTMRGYKSPASMVRRTWRAPYGDESPTMNRWYCALGRSHGDESPTTNCHAVRT